LIDQLRRRRVPLIGKAGGWWSFVHVDDATAATALAVEKGAPGPSTTIPRPYANGCLKACNA